VQPIYLLPRCSSSPTASFQRWRSAHRRGHWSAALLLTPLLVGLCTLIYRFVERPFIATASDTPIAMPQDNAVPAKA